MNKTERGRAGYEAAIAKMGKEEFHKAGGEAYAKMDGFTCDCHGVGIEAFKAHYPLKGKKHRYTKTEGTYAEIIDF